MNMENSAVDGLTYLCMKMEHQSRISKFSLIVLTVEGSH